MKCRPLVLLWFPLRNINAGSFCHEVHVASRFEIFLGIASMMFAPNVTTRRAAHRRPYGFEHFLSITCFVVPKSSADNRDFRGEK